MIKIGFLIVVLFVHALNKYSLEWIEKKHVFQNRRAIRLFVTPCDSKHTHIHTYMVTWKFYLKRGKGEGGGGGGSFWIFRNGGVAFGMRGS